MTIHTYQSFFNLIKNDSLPVKDSLADCLVAVSRICACKKPLKMKKSEQCNNIYINFIKNEAHNYISLWKTKTSDDVIIFYHNTHHLIKEITL